jgi:hypothetical protein
MTMKVNQMALDPPDQHRSPSTSAPRCSNPAEHGREMVAKSTKDGLAAAKAKGVVLGNHGRWSILPPKAKHRHDDTGRQG